jgi:type I restriction enzyme M protein
MPTKIERIFSEPEVRHGLSLFSQEEIAEIEARLTEDDGRFYIFCPVKRRNKLAKPEEIVRQLWIDRLLHEYCYPLSRVDVERVVYFGSRESGLADIVVLHEDLEHPYIIFEVKRPRRTDGLGQLKSYCNAEGAPIGVWSNGNEMARLHREEPNIFIELPRLPQSSESLRDVLTERWTIEWLEEHDELRQGKTTLKGIILNLEELVLGNAGVRSFDEIFKLVYAKLYDEWRGVNGRGYLLDFYAGDRSPGQVKCAVQNLLEGAKRTWPGVFEPTDRIELIDSHLKVCVSFLSNVKLFNSNLRVIDEAFEYLIPEVSKKKEGQFFTPRPVVDMIVRMLNPKVDEYVIDPACGSAGFLLHSILWIAGGSLTGRDLPPPAKNFAQNYVYGVDFAKEAVRIAKAINLIVGDGRSHVFGGAHGNSLNPAIWDDEIRAGLRPRLLRLRDAERDRDNQEKMLNFDFDVLMTNPPFAGTVTEREILRLYELGEKNGRLQRKVGRHILFLNRCLQLIRPGGRLAIVLPQGLFNNTKAEYIRRFIIDRARVLAVVGLHGNTFKPHTGTKTAVLFLQKYSEGECLRISSIKSRYEEEWGAELARLRVTYADASWRQMPASPISEELEHFLEAFFGPPGGDIEAVSDEDESTAEEGLPINQDLIQELADLEQAESDLARSLEGPVGSQRRSIEKDIGSVRRNAQRIKRKLSEQTLGGQVFLTLNEDRTARAFKDSWLNGRLAREIDYPIFFGINEMPVKDNSGEYRWVKDSEGRIVMDSAGNPKIDHDLDQIAEAFQAFARSQGFYFWRDHQ